MKSVLANNAQHVKHVTLLHMDVTLPYMDVALQYMDVTLQGAPAFEGTVAGQGQGPVPNSPCKAVCR